MSSAPRAERADRMDSAPRSASGRSRSGRYAPARQTRQKPKFTLKKLMLFLIPAVALMAVAAVALLMVEHGSSYTFTDSGSQYYAGSRGTVLPGAKLVVQSDGTVDLSQNDVSSRAELPIYMDGKQELVIPKNMVFYMPRSGKSGRALYFSNFSVLDSGTVNMNREGANTQHERGFLYDGRDIYVFLEGMKVRFNGYEVELPPMSYVEAVYGGNIMLFNYETKECILEPTETTAMAEALTGEYEISLFGDSMTTSSGEKTLLVSRPDLMDPIA